MTKTGNLRGEQRQLPGDFRVERVGVDQNLIANVLQSRFNLTKLLQKCFVEQQDLAFISFSYRK